MDEQKERYLDICRSHTLPIQFQPWWLDAVCSQGSWNVSLATGSNGRVNGVFPYYTTKRFGTRMIAQPPYTSYCGPWLFYPEEPDMKNPARYNFETKTLEALIAQLPPLPVFKLQFHPQISNGLPFHWEGYRQSTRYTYTFGKEDGETPIKHWRSGTKNKIQSTEHFVRLVENVNFGLTLEQYKHALRRIGKQKAGNHAPLIKLYNALGKNQQIALLGLESLKDQSVVAVQAIAFDTESASFLYSGQLFDPEYRYVNYRMLAESLQWCWEKGLRVDMEGSMHRGLELVFRSMGGRRTPYLQVSKIRPRILEAGLVLLGKL